MTDEAPRECKTLSDSEPQTESARRKARLTPYRPQASRDNPCTCCGGFGAVRWSFYKGECPACDGTGDNGIAIS